MEKNANVKEYKYLLGERIRKVRELKGLKQEYVAEKLCISSGHYSNIENGRRSCTMPLFINLCLVLDTTPNELLYDCLPMDSPNKGTLLVELSQSYNAGEREFLYGVQRLFNEFLKKHEE